MTIAAVILAAGAGTRMGGPKAFLEWQGETFLARVMRTARAGACSPIVVILAAGTDTTRIDLRDVTVVENPRPDDGQLSSLKLGIECAAADSRVSAVLSWPVDHPFVAKQTLTTLVRVHEADPTKIVVPTCEARGGHPTLVPRPAFDDLLALPLDRGMRPLLERHAAEVLRIPVEDPGVRRDIDTPEDLARLGKP